MNISLCLTTYQRTDLLFESFASVIEDDRISEIIISDDASDPAIYDKIVNKFVRKAKVKLFSNETNLDCYLNKAKALSRASNDWCILFDSDNVIDKSYLDRLENLWIAGLNDRQIYQPEFARPHFDFRHIAGENINRRNIGYFIKKGNTATMLNAMNFFVNRNEYLKVFDQDTNPVTSDSIYQNYRWLNAGNSIYVVEGLQYEHRVHEGSHYKNNVTRTPNGFNDKILKLLTEMR